MTQMQTTQERERLLDEVVPPAPRMRRLAVIAVVMFLVAALATVAHAEGAFTPSFLVGDSDASWGVAPGGNGVELSFSLQSMRGLPVTIEGIEAAAPWFSHPGVSSVTSFGGGNRRSLPTRVSDSQPIDVVIIWAQLDCSQIDNGQRFGLPIHYRTALGLNGTTVVSMLWKTRTVGAAREVTIDPFRSMWSDSVTWTNCGA
jgi:hypothetical protein